MQRLAINLGGYKGEGIDIHRILPEIQRLALASGWELEPLRPSEQTRLPAFQRIVRNARKQIYISSGIHGDEPAGPLTILELFKQNQWPADISLWIIPCLNPGGFVLNRRENEAGIDLNRDYRDPKTDAVRAHIAWLEQRPRFDLSLCLHEDWEANGFYLYELNPDRQPSLADSIITKVKAVCPVDLSPVIEERKASNGVICANPDLLKRPDWPEAFYLIHHKTRLSYTLEAPSDFPTVTRVNALTASVRAVFWAM